MQFAERTFETLPTRVPTESTICLLLPTFTKTLACKDESDVQTDFSAHVCPPLNEFENSETLEINPVIVIINEHDDPELDLIIILAVGSW
jgi:hypothetical protein